MVPDWLEERHAGGILEIGTLSLGDLRLANVRASLHWDAANIDATEIGAQLGDGLINGQFPVNLRRAIAQYVEENFHVRYRPEDEILVTVGVSEAPAPRHRTTSPRASAR